MPIQYYRPETYDVETSIGYLLKRAHLVLVDRLEPVLASNDLTFTQWVVLMNLRYGLAVNASVLCAQLRHDSGALTRVIDQLEGRGLVSRERSRRDRRSVQLQLTELGQSTVQGLIPPVVEQLNASLGALSEPELTELTRLLMKLTASLEQSEQDTAPSSLPDRAGEPT